MALSPEQEAELAAIGYLPGLAVVTLKFIHRAGQVVDNDPFLAQALDKLLKTGCVERLSNGRVALTDLGRLVIQDLAG